MTEYENNSMWQCQYYGDGRYRSSNQFLKIAGIYEPSAVSFFMGKRSLLNLENICRYSSNNVILFSFIRNISLSLHDDPLTLTEGNFK